MAREPNGQSWIWVACACLLGKHLEWGKLKSTGGTPPNAFDLHSSLQVTQKKLCSCRWLRLGDDWLNRLTSVGRGPQIKSNSLADDELSCRLTAFCPTAAEQAA